MLYKIIWVQRVYPSWALPSVAFLYLFLSPLFLLQLTVSIIFGFLLRLRLRALNLINLFFCLLSFIFICFKRILSNAMPCVAVIWCGLIWRWEMMMGWWWEMMMMRAAENSRERESNYIYHLRHRLHNWNKWKMSELSFPRTVGVFFFPDSSAFGVLHSSPIYGNYRKIRYVVSQGTGSVFLPALLVN